MSILERTRQAIFEVFGQYIAEDPEDAKEIIRKSTFTGEDDPGGWSPGAAVIIHTETGIPSGLWNTKVLEAWFEVSEIISPYYCENINAAVIGVYK